MKLGVSYNAFNGCELLEYSINQIRNLVDYIVIVYQIVSWFGDKKIYDKDLEILKDLKNRNIINDLILFEIIEPAKNQYESQILESKKRNLGRDYCIKNECTHFLDMDVDEFYINYQFEATKNYIEENDIPYTIVEYINYFKLPIYQSIRNHNNIRYVPFICKIFNNENIIIDSNNFFIYETFISVDKTRFYNTCEIKFLFDYNTIMMHHMTGVRKNLEDKFFSYSGRNMKIERNVKHLSDSIKNLKDANLNFNKQFEDLLFFNHLAIEKVDNIFSIPLGLFE